MSDDKALTKAQVTAATAAVRGSLERMEADIMPVMPNGVTLEWILGTLYTAVYDTPEIIECSPASIIVSLLAAARLGLEVNSPLGHAYLIPYKRECTFQPGYRGLLELCERSGKLESVQADVVKGKDVFNWGRGTEVHLQHRWDPELDAREAAPLLFAWAMIEVRGRTKPEIAVLTRSMVDKRRALGAPNGPWVKWYDRMAMKTALKQALNLCPKSAEVRFALVADAASGEGSRPPAFDWQTGEVLEKHRLAPSVIDAPTPELESGAGAGARAAAAAKAAEVRARQSAPPRETPAPAAPARKTGAARKEPVKPPAAAAPAAPDTEPGPAQTPPCDGNHAAPACASPFCWRLVPEDGMSASTAEEPPRRDETLSTATTAALDAVMPMPVVDDEQARRARQANIISVGGWKWVERMMKTASVPEVEAIRMLKAGFEIINGQVVEPKKERT